MKSATVQSPVAPVARAVARVERKSSKSLSEAVIQHGSIRKAATALGVPRTTISRRLLVEAKAWPTRKSSPSKSVPVAPAELTALTAALQSLATSQALQGKLLERLLGSDEIRVKTTKAAKPEKEPAPEKPIAGGTLAEPETRTLRATGRRFILTAAQNNTLVHVDFLASLKTMAKATGAEIIISRFTYNKNAWGNGSNIARESDDVWYAGELQPYLTSFSTRLAEDLMFCAELDRLPTAVDPLSGLDSYTKESSGIVGHPKVAMKSMPVMMGDAPRFMYSTGCVTQRNYVDRLAGQKAAFHHTFAALFVEVDEDGLWFARQLVAGESGEFQDLETVYTPHGTRTERVAAVIYGDLHAEKMDAWMPAILWGAGGIRETLRPEVQVAHDAGDFSDRNHHNVDDPFFLLSVLVSGGGTVEGNFETTASTLAQCEWADGITVIPDANHMLQALMIWLKKAEFRKDPANMRYFLQLSLRLCEAIEAGDKKFDIYEWALRQKNPLPNTRFLRSGESYRVCGVELGIHGHQGPNGARGSPKGYRSLGRRTFTGHTHSAGIVDSVYTVGVSGSLNMGYNEGPPSSWSHSHGVVYSNGKRAIITQRGPRWRGAKIRYRVQAGSLAA